MDRSRRREGREERDYKDDKWVDGYIHDRWKDTEGERGRKREIIKTKDR